RRLAGRVHGGPARRGRACRRAGLLSVGRRPRDGARVRPPRPRPGRGAPLRARARRARHRGRVTVATIALGSYAVQFPVGGYLSWVLRWLVGLRDLGHEPWFVERAHFSGSCFDPSTNTMSDDCSYGTTSLHALLDRYSLGDRWCFVDARGEYHGRSRAV